jgi:hypothetical protein
MTEAQAEALDAVHFTAADNCVTIPPQAGDTLFLNNLAILHSRSLFQDSPEAKRYVLRLRLNNPERCWDIPSGLRLTWDRVFADVDEIQNYWDIDPYDDERRGRHFATAHRGTGQSSSCG